MYPCQQTYLNNSFSSTFQTQMRGFILYIYLSLSLSFLSGHWKYDRRQADTLKEYLMRQQLVWMISAKNVLKEPKTALIPPLGAPT